MKVGKDYSDFRYKFVPYVEKSDPRQLDEYKSHRDKDLNRSENRIHNRFPSLSNISH